MPSPFPGMDPYLENQLLWHDVHQSLAVQISRQLTPLLAPRYVARLATCFVTFTPDEQEISIIYPNVDVTPTRLRERTSTQLRRPPAEPPKSVAPVIFEPAPLTLPAVIPEQLKLVTVELRDVAQGRLVAAVEILPLANKLTRAERRNFYSAKYGAVSGAYPTGHNAPLAGYCT
jgi:hypothetical protein